MCVRLCVCFSLFCCLLFDIIAANLQSVQACKRNKYKNCKSLPSTIFASPFKQLFVKYVDSLFCGKSLQNKTKNIKLVLHN